MLILSQGEETKNLILIVNSVSVWMQWLLLSMVLFPHVEGKHIDQMLMLISKQHLSKVPQPLIAPFGRAILLIFALCLHWLAFTERGLITAPPQSVYVCVSVCVLVFQCV